MVGTYIRSESVVSRVIANEMLIVPVRGKVGDLASIYSLNATATAAWDALSSPITIEQLVDIIVNNFEVERERAQAELKAFLDEMCAAGLVQIGPVINCQADQYSSPASG